MLYLILLALFLLFLIVFIFWIVSHLISYFYGIPFVVSSDARTRHIMKLLNPKKGEKIVDLGSGDGKLLFEISQYGSRAYGFEINPIAYFQSVIRTKRLGLKNIDIYWGNFMKKDLSDFDAVVVYGISTMMARLEHKLKRELKPGTRVVSNYFEFPNLKPLKKEGDVLLYIIPQLQR